MPYTGLGLYTAQNITETRTVLQALKTKTNQNGNKYNNVKRRN